MPVSMPDTHASAGAELERLLHRPADERAARATIRAQITRLERELGVLTVDLWHAGRTRAPSPGEAVPRAAPDARVLTFAELTASRDALVERVSVARDGLERRSDTERRARARLERMLADPGAHRFHLVQRVDLGEPSCGAYQVLPKLGLLGMLFGWWRVRISSGCPLAVRHHGYRHPRERWPGGRSAAPALRWS